MDYRQAVAYIEEIPRFTKKHTLEHTKEFLKKLGNPGISRKVIHVAGTNGKGSVCAYIRAILMAEQKHCGFFTSPHLVTINERIQVDDRPVDDEEFLNAFCRVHQTALAMEAGGMAHPSYFEFLFGMAMVVFEQSSAEYLILETGLGGRLDATNAVEHPALTVITSISLDHTEILGETIREIAFEKAGIIKKGVPVIFDGSDSEAAEVIRDVAGKKQALCREISKNAFKIREVTPKSIAFSRTNAYDKDTVWQIPICGVYQAANATLALEAAELLLGKENAEMAVRRERWQQALLSVHWEGRMETVMPHVTVDGAHNPGAVEAFTENLHTLYPEGMKPPVIVFAAVSDKKYEQMIAHLCRELDAKVYVVTEIEDKRRIRAEELRQVFEKYTGKPVYCAADIEEAVKKAVHERGDAEVYCLGSLYLAGAIKKLGAGGKNHA